MTGPDHNDQMIADAADAIEEEMIRRLGRDLGTIHRDAIIGACLAAGLEVMADEIDRGPTFPRAASIISQLVRERAERLRAIE